MSGVPLVVLMLAAFLAVVGVGCVLTSIYDGLARYFRWPS